MGETFTDPDWIEASEMMAGEEAGAGDVVNRPAKALLADLERLMQDVYADAVLDGASGELLARPLQLRTAWDGVATSPGGEREALPTARSYLRAIVYEGLIYVIGGGEAGSPGTVSGDLYVYSPTFNAWEKKRSSMPTPRRNHVAERVGSQLHAIGGIDGIARHTTHEVFDLDNESWSLAAPLPTRRDGMGSAVISGMIHVVGGYEQGGVPATLSDHHEAYDPENDEWLAKAVLPAARGDIRAAEVSGLLYAGGGTTQAGTNADDLYLYDGVLDTWTQKADMPIARVGHAMIAASTPLANGPGVYVLAGERDVFLGRIDLYLPEQDTWVTDPDRPPNGDPYHQVAWALCNGTIYLIGGFEGNPANLRDANKAMPTAAALFTAERTGYATIRFLTDEAFDLVNLTSGQPGSCVGFDAGDQIGARFVPAWEDRTVSGEVIAC